MLRCVGRILLLVGKKPMVDSFNISEMMSKVSPGDALLARRLRSGCCQFFAWPGQGLLEVAEGISSIPRNVRTVHTVFGREGTPMDLALDIDCPIPSHLNKSVDAVQEFQQQHLQKVLKLLHGHISAAGHEIQTQMVLRSASLKKVSFHVHARLKDGAAFKDYRSLGQFVRKMANEERSIDAAIYRNHGMLRVASSLKEDLTSPMMIVPMDWATFGMINPSEQQEQIYYSLAIRAVEEVKQVIEIAPPAEGPPAQNTSSALNPKENRKNSPAATVHRSLNLSCGEEGRFLWDHPEKVRDIVVECLLGLDSRLADPWKTWVKVGLLASNVATDLCDTHGLDVKVIEEAFHTFSAKCSFKYDGRKVATQWESMCKHHRKKASRFPPKVALASLRKMSTYGEDYIEKI